MTPRYPGARWYGIGGQGGSCSHRSMSWHQAVTTGGVDAIAGWTSTARACHGFTAKDGDAGQYAEFSASVAGVYNGNSQVCTWENWDGLLPATNRSPDGTFGPNDRDWTPAQFERNADLMAWAVDGLGIPLHLMANTEEPGHGPHRLGVPQASGNVELHYGPTCWTMHPGKQCPGDLRILALPAMLARAAVILAGVRAGRFGWLPTGPVDTSTLRGATTPTPQTDWIDELMATVTEEQKALLLAGAQAAVDMRKVLLADGNIQELMNRSFVLVDHSNKQLGEIRFDEVATDVVNRLFIIQDHVDHPESRPE